MPLGACRLNRRILALMAGLCASVNFIACGHGKPTNPPSGLTERVLASQGVTTNVTFGGLVIINGYDDTIPRLAPIGAGSSPGLMAISPSRNVVAAFDASSNKVYAVDTSTEKDIGNVQLQGATVSMAVPTSAYVGYAAVPSATVSGYNFIGAVDVMNFSTGGVTTIAVPSAQWVFSNSTGTQLLVFSNGSDSITVLTPSAATPPVDLSCIPNPANPTNPTNPAVCQIVAEPAGSRPVFAIITGSTAYVMNCGYECGGVTSGGQPAQPNVAVFDLNSLTVTNTINVNGATWGLLNGTTLYVAGNGTPTGPLCSSLTNSINPTTAATYCGTLDVVNLTTMLDPYLNSPSTEIAIPDGYHDRMDFTSDGQLFVGSYNCTNIGNVTSPSGEVRGCLAIYNTNNNTLIIPPDNGDVGGFQGFTTRYIEYVAEGGNLRVYDTITDTLYINSQYLPTGSIDVVGYVGDVKAIDFF
jgi:hypothetical protein